MECVDGRHPPSKTPAGVLPWTCRSENRLAGKVTLTSGLLLGRSEVLRSLRHYLRAQSQGHHTIDRLEERGVERRSARRSSLNLKGREGGHRQSDEHGNRFKGNVGDLKLLREGLERIWAFPGA